MSYPLTQIDKELLISWAQVVRKALESGIEIFIVGDTETTGKHELGDKNNFGKKDRILEIGFLFYTSDESGLLKPLSDHLGNHIRFHEYINPFIEDANTLDRYNSIKEIPNEVIRIHGIDIDFLKGNCGLLDSWGKRTNFKLNKSAPTFTQIKPYLEMLMNCNDLVTLKGRINFIAHNALFDARFMSAEWIKTEQFDEKSSFPSSFESYVWVIDSLALMRSLYSRADIISAGEKKGCKMKAGFSLDYLKEFYSINQDRDMHGALVDSKILADVYNSIVMDERYSNSPAVCANRTFKSDYKSNQNRNLVSF
ncbi:hypothetical protein [Vibrio sp. D431a]|uniref:hypothetical protein n=1 Tax=Vibrio sp. D431a TaxID=2837388 RepID=UPI0025525D7D|nr:hypothetical protein [Vibrio sp. D431a]MDK9793879.1 hypothetical protein [Vibrio sp. D431a]